LADNTKGKTMTNNLELFDRKGTFVQPSDDVMAKLTPELRTLIGHVGDAAHNLESAMLAIAEAEQELKTVRAEIELAEKQMPRQSRIDLVRDMIATGNKRRAGL
jgi:hypothetical protein